MSTFRAAVLSLAALAGCAALACDGDASRLLAKGRVALERKDLPGAYRDLTEIRRRRPASPEAAEAFPLAAATFQYLYFRERLDPASAWMKTEPAFMLDWFASFLAGPDFPEAEARALFVGMPYGYFREYEALAATRPDLARFRIAAEEDNGIIEHVSAGLH